MAKTSKQCPEYQRTVVRHLAQIFPVESPGGVRGVTLPDLAGSLGVMEEEARIMVQLGAFGPMIDELPTEWQVLRFFERNGRRWVLARLERQLKRMRELAKFRKESTK